MSVLAYPGVPAHSPRSVRRSPPAIGSYRAVIHKVVIVAVGNLACDAIFPIAGLVGWDVNLECVRSAGSRTHQN